MWTYIHTHHIHTHHVKKSGVFFFLKKEQISRNVSISDINGCNAIAQAGKGFGYFLPCCLFITNLLQKAFCSRIKITL